MKKNKITGLVGTLVLHAIVLLLLFLISISKPKAQEEGGVPVMLGNMEMAQGNADPYTLTDVDVLDEPQMPAEASVPEPVPETPSETEMITQEDEPSIAVPKKETPKPKTKTEIVKAKKEIVKADKEIAKAKVKSEAEKRAEAERLAAEKKAAEERAAAEAAAKRITEKYLTTPRKSALAVTVSQAEDRLIRPELRRTCSVYIGIPFCPSRCSYCSFVSYTSPKLLSLIPDYLTALQTNIHTVFETIRELGLTLSTV